MAAVIVKAESSAVPAEEGPISVHLIGAISGAARTSSLVATGSIKTRKITARNAITVKIVTITESIVTITASIETITARIATIITTIVTRTVAESTVETETIVIGSSFSSTISTTRLSVYFCASHC